MPNDIGILLIVGAVFFLIGLLGGGLEISAIKVPSMGKMPRILSTGVGAIFMGIAVSRLISSSISSPEHVNMQKETQSPTPAFATIETPTLIGLSAPIVTSPARTDSSASACPVLDLSRVEHRSTAAILFDEAHNNRLSLSEEKALQLDTRPQLYAYAGDLADYIRKQGYSFVAIETGPFSPTKLANYDLLVEPVGGPSTTFTACEIDAIVSYVANGGGLLVLGDGLHSNQFNPLLELFGIRMAKDPVTTIGVVDYPENFWVTGFSGHPATGDTTEAWFNWGTSIEILDTSWSVLINSPENVWLDVNSDHAIDESEPRGPFVVGAAREFGLGHVIVYGDNNVWDYYLGSNYPMYLAMVRWAIGDPARFPP